jgi:hypothetical protein
MSTKKVLLIIVSLICCVFNANANHINLITDTIFSWANFTQTGWATIGSYMACGGNFYCGADFYCGGNKYFLQPHPSDSDKVIAYIAIESGEALTLARGMSVTKGGQSEIVLPDHFSLVTSPDIPVTVLLTPEKSPATLYVKQKSKEKIIIAVKAAEYSEFGDVEFSYQVTGVRDGFENSKAIRDASNIDDTTNISLKQKRMKTKLRVFKEMEKIKDEEKRLKIKSEQTKQ